MGLEADAIQFSDRGDAAAEPPEGADVVGGEQQLDVTATPALGQLDQAFVNAGCLRKARGLECLQAGGGLGVRRRHADQVSLGAGDVLACDLAFEFQLPKVPKHRAGLCGQPIRFGLQRANAGGHARTRLIGR